MRVSVRIRSGILIHPGREYTGGAPMLRSSRRCAVAHTGKHYGAALLLGESSVGN